MAVAVRSVPVVRLRVSAETWGLTCLCMADLACSAFLFQTQRAVEANPVLLVFLRHGVPAFCAGKLLCFLPSLALAEWYRRYNDGLVRLTLRAVTVGYLVLWTVGFLRHNPLG